MAVEKKTFAEWCERFGIDESKAASITEAAAVALTDALTEVQFRQIAPQTVEDFLKCASRLKKDERTPFCKKFGFDLDDSISGEEFQEKLAQYNQEQESAKPAPSADSKPDPSTKPKPAKALRLRVTGCTVMYDHKEYPDGKLLPADFPAGERDRLLKLGAIVKE